ncbi:hypothetical protein AXF42_Ash017978 [Apostasia shenzhenica]|uniref:Uncharacterized protein n=1 Tax=Apostasia shenzhenica TaxID=1088818 RepID=A0A2I0A516_9ASPA|nr:hypothetical protein AXF42_Ash017978 [Apostasia shenzhenica]
MKKLYNGKGKRVHPSPTPASPYDLLAALPAAVFALAAALSPEEREVLAYLLSGGSQEKIAGKKQPITPNHPRWQTHPPELNCGCFSCYKSFWARWDASPNRHLIHQILDAVEEPIDPKPLPGDRRHRRRRSRRKDFAEEESPAAVDAEEMRVLAEDDGNDVGFEEGIVRSGDADGDCRSPMRRLVKFIGETVWGAWN